MGTCDSIPPIGAPIETLAGPDGGIRIQVAGRSTVYAQGALSLLVLNRGDLEVIKELAVGPNRDGVAAIKSSVEGHSSGALVIISARAGLDPGAVAEFNRIVATIGARPLDAGEAGNGRPFSVIGVPGWPQGAAFENVGRPTAFSLGQRSRVHQGAPVPRPNQPLSVRHREGSGAGTLDGYVQLDPRSGAYGFVYGGYDTFDTSTARTSRTNTIDVAGNSYTATLPSDTPAGTSGFHVLLLDPSTLEPLRDEDDQDINWAWPVNTGDRTQDAGWQTGLATLLQQAIDEHALVFIQSIGTPKPTTEAWNKIADRIEKLGGTRIAFNDLDGGSYALVSRVGSPDGATESIQDPPASAKLPAGYRTGQTGRLDGVLARGREVRYEPLLFDPSGNRLNTNFNAILYQAPTPWPDSTTPGEKAANAYIATELDLPVKSDVRLNYTNDLVNWTTEAERLRRLTYPTNASFTEAEFDAVKNELAEEFTWVDVIKTRLIPSLKKPYETSALTSFAKLQVTANHIIDVTGTRDTDVQVKYLRLAEQAIYAALNYFSPGTGDKAKWVSIGIQTYVEYADSAPDEHGVPLTARLRARTDQLTLQLVDRYQGALVALDQAGDFIVTDYGKLKAAYENTRTGEWTSTTATQAAAARALELSAKRWYYESLLPVAYHWYRLYYTDRPVHVVSDCRGLPKFEDRVYYNEPVGGQIRVRPGIAADPARSKPEVWALYRRTTEAGIPVKDPPPDWLIDPLFAPISPDKPDDLGLFKPWFFSHVISGDGQFDCSTSR